jgi:nucleoside-diphosphate-sugar epimerase
MENVDEYALRRDPGGRLVLRLPLSEDLALHWIAVDDVATLARLAFDRPGSFGPGPVQLGADHLSIAQVCALLGDRLGEEVRYEQVAVGEVEDRHARGMYRWFQSCGPYDPDVQDLRRLHPGLLTFRQWLEAGRLDLGKVERGSAAAA